MDCLEFIKLLCQEQQATRPEDYIGMGMAYAGLLAVYEMSDSILLWDVLIETTAAAVDYQANKYGYRKVPVVFDGGGSAAAPAENERLINQLISAWRREAITPEEFYQEFERIHPFADGNGRVGALLYNYLKGTIHDPILPPDYTGNYYHNKEG